MRADARRGHWRWNADLPGIVPQRRYIRHSLMGILSEGQGFAALVPGVNGRREDSENKERRKKQSRPKSRKPAKRCEKPRQVNRNRALRKAHKVSPSRAKRYRPDRRLSKKINAVNPPFLEVCSPRNSQSSWVAARRVSAHRARAKLKPGDQIGPIGANVPSHERDSLKCRCISSQWLRRRVDSASVPIPKFASFRGAFLCELRNRRTLANY